MAVSSAESEVVPIVFGVINKALGLISNAGLNVSNSLNNIQSDANKEVIKFISSYNVNLLLVSIAENKSKPKVTLSTNVLGEIAPNSKTIMLVKTQSTVISKENVHSALTIISTSNEHDIAKQFKSSLQNLYIPYFKSTQSDIVKPLQDIYDSIESKYISSDKLSKITSIDDEIRYNTSYVTYISYQHKHITLA